MVTRGSAINTAKSFIGDCKTNGLIFFKVLIFGSVAKDTLHEWSDIGLILICYWFRINSTTMFLIT